MGTDVSFGTIGRFGVVPFDDFALVRQGLVVFLPLIGPRRLPANGNDLCIPGGDAAEKRLQCIHAFRLLFSILLGKRLGIARSRSVGPSFRKPSTACGTPGDFRY
ncbi:MAG TPA: hypothetical protein VKZ53_18450 [Candidatus Angelobacter sp.]|nr:hypothetical protein [Candidatus Angelobacter sp.]